MKRITKVDEREVKGADIGKKLFEVSVKLAEVESVVGILLMGGDIDEATKSRLTKVSGHLQEARKAFQGD